MRVEDTNGLIRELSEAIDRPGVRAVLFDLDDTLFDHQHCSRAGLLALREGFPALAAEPFEAFEQRYRVLLEEVHLRALSGELSPAAARLERFSRFLSAVMSATQGDAERAGALYQAAFRAARRPVAGAVELLSHLRPHVSIGVVTNNVRHEQVEKLKFCGFESLVDVLVTSEEVGFAKPHPAIFHAALERLSCASHEVVMVGDNWENDIVGASRVGIRSIWLNRYAEPHLDETLAPQIVELTPLEEIARLLLGRI
jgi:putative hydrolase of the HAD superfamily